MDALERINNRLTYFLSMTDVLKNGEVVEKRVLVGNIKKVKIEIYPNEHPPPHFHVKTNDFEATFTILECKLLRGNISSKDQKRIEYFHSRSMDLLIETWNAMRPTDCQVGPIVY